MLYLELVQALSRYCHVKAPRGVASFSLCLCFQCGDCSLSLISHLHHASARCFYMRKEEKSLSSVRWHTFSRAVVNLALLGESNDNKQSKLK